MSLEIHRYSLALPEVMFNRWSDPNWWDQFFYSGDPTLYSLLELQTEDNLLKIRQSQIHYNLQDYQAAYHHIADIHDAPAPGLRMLYLEALEQTEGLVETPISTPRTPLEFESAVYAHFAKGLVHSTGEKFDLAIQQLEVAETYALALGLANRIAFLRLEKERLAIWLGQPHPQHIEAIMQVVLNPRARVWAQSLLSTANLYSGRYSKVIESFDKNGETIDLALAQVLLGRTVDTEPLTDPQQQQLIDTIEALWKGDFKSIKSPNLGRFRDGYTRVMVATALVHQGQFHLAEQSLGDEPIQPDAAFWWGLLHIGLATEINTPIPWNKLSNALDRLQQYRYVMAFATAHMPYELFLATQYLQHPALKSVLSDIPICIGRELRYKHLKIAIAPQTYQALNADALIHQPLLYPALHRMEKKRYRDLLQSWNLKPRQVVIDGGLIRRLQALIQHPHPVWQKMLDQLQLHTKRVLDF